MERGSEKWLLVDGHNMAFRCFYGVPQMATADGTPVNAAYGWARSMWKLEDIVVPDAVCVFFDAGGSAARREIMSAYKANRKAMPDALKRQLEYVHLLSVAHGYYIVSMEGIEADDLLAEFAKMLSDRGATAYIASGDKDFAQCVGDNIFQMLPPSAGTSGTWIILDRNGVKEKFGIFPEQIVDYLSLLGDTSDNISGVSGIGEKGATRLLNEFGTIDNMLQNLHRIPSDRVKSALRDSSEIIARNRKLIALATAGRPGNSSDPGCSPFAEGNGSNCIQLPEAVIRRSPDDIFALLEKLQLRSLLKTARRRYAHDPSQQELFG
jgi:DNA polymerase-1